MVLRSRTQRLRSLPVNSLIPNILTILALCAGLTAMRFALAEEWELAVVAIIVAGILDGLDGRLARLLKGTSKFGAELDSLSDFVSFGVAPGFVLYRWNLAELGGVGWIVVLAFAVCMALRLARFNTALDDPNKPPWAANFFTGIPAPAAGGLALLPLALSFQYGGVFFRMPVVAAVFTIFLSFMMVSQIPTYSFKKLRVRREYVLPVLLVVGLAAAVLASYPWLTLTVLALVYLASIPLSVRSFRRQVAAAEGGEGEAADKADKAEKADKKT
ncbi:MAG: CDP-diacylglycerol--serine O-phosphatidyltransferase [Alphaproteobacteria bacterium]|jgi:CDP-diacylglycerol--serine O-phosphatidyltransferase|nr:CDP-diacylglycerol--serine O-phosphatidyltransferase [Alphaproteobacteria bacterium]